jgi:periplasmic divalent cation tolerance protein
VPAPCVVFITAPHKASKRLASLIVEERLAACVNIVSSVQSLYWWKGRVQNDREDLLIAKTQRALFKRLVSFVRRHHPYTVPEIIALPIAAGHRDYLKWIEKETR